MKKTLEFLEDCFYNGKLAHKKGDIEEIEDSIGYATRWLVYGKAKIVEKVELKKDTIEIEVKKEEIILEEEPKKIVNIQQIIENKKVKRNKTINKGI